MAWQTLIKTEQKLRNTYNLGEFLGDLDIIVNHPTAPIRYDTYDSNTKTYSWKSFTLSNLPDDMLRDVLREYPFVAFNIRYEIEMDSPSLILGGDTPPTLLVDFYPFARPFFHKAENLLDEALFKALRDNAEELLKAKQNKKS
jgi:hypothetical protein